MPHDLIAYRQHRWDDHEVWVEHGGVRAWGRGRTADVAEGRAVMCLNLPDAPAVPLLVPVEFPAKAPARARQHRAVSGRGRLVA